MSYETIALEVSGHVATLTLNRPDAANTINLQMAKDLYEVAIRCDDDPEIRAVVLTGSGTMFCAGGDLQAFKDIGDGLKSALKEMTGYLHAGISRLTRMDAPVIAAVNGMAAGAGFSLAAAADLAIAKESAAFVMAYTNAGLAPDCSSTFFLPRRIGDRRARELMLTNRMLTAQEAVDWGVINQAVPDEEFDAVVAKLADKIANGPTRAFGAVKALLNETFEHGLESQMELEARAISSMADTDDGREGIAAFLEKRKPEFTGR